MKKTISVVSLFLFCGAMMFIARQGNCIQPVEKEESVMDTQLEISITTKGDKVSLGASGESVNDESTEQISTEQISTEQISTEDIADEDVSTENASAEDTSVEGMPEADKNVVDESQEAILTEDDIYSFFQRTEHWYQQIAWSGEWSTWDIDGNVFGNFGCGLCCMANIYDTLSPYEVSPWDMFEYAQTVSGYSPNGSSAAISWGYMKTVLDKCGFSCELYCKPGSYEAFRQQISECTSAVVLVSSANDNTFWTTTGGHYVTIWLYEEETDTVFLADPGKIARNRQRIPLRYVYNALKTASNYQYLTVDEYVEENNVWKSDQITEDWIRP